jgi:hypothetical protein
MEEGIIDMGAYSDSLINLGPYVGAYGEIYLNEDDKVVAVNPTVTRLHGNINSNGTRFDLDDGTHLDLDNTEYSSPSSVFIVNSAEQYTFSSCAAFAYMPLTIYADVKGDSIDKIYSAVYWNVDDHFEVDSSIINEIAEEKTINGWELPMTDGGEINYGQLGIYGAFTLADLKEGDNIYVYQNYNSHDEVNYIEVGKGKISGEITEYDDNDDYVDKYTIGDQQIKSYKMFPKLDVGAAYDISLDAWGFIYDADKTSGATDTYGVVKAATAATSFDNYKIKLFTSDDSTKTYYLAEENPADIDWTTTGGLTIGAVTTGGLIGYSLDSNGKIDAVDNTYMTSSGIVLKSAKLLGNNPIDSEAVVFTYNGSMSNTESFDVASLSDIDPGTAVATAASPAAFILNRDGDVVALFIEDDFADAADDAIYGVINSRKTTSNDDGKKVYKFTGYIDGTAFTYKTDAGSTGFDGFTSKFGVYAITLDSSGLIAGIAALDLDGTDADGNTCSYFLNTSDAAEVITELAFDNTVISAGGEKYTVSDDAAVYKYDTSDKAYTVSKLSALRRGSTVSLYDTKGKDADGIATVVIYIAN